MAVIDLQWSVELGPGCCSVDYSYSLYNCWLNIPAQTCLYRQPASSIRSANQAVFEINGCCCMMLNACLKSIISSHVQVQLLILDHTVCDFAFCVYIFSDILVLSFFFSVFSSNHRVLTYSFGTLRKFLNFMRIWAVFLDRIVIF